MKKFTLLLSVSLFGLFSVQKLEAQNSEKCAAETMFQEAAAKNPELLKARSDYEKGFALYVQNKKFNRTSQVNKPRIIPVVFHVIYQDACGTENIQKEQIENQIRILNKDYKRLNADTVNTPAYWAGFAAYPNIEFRLATKDPNGKCTDGIVRVQSALTNGVATRDNLKAVSYWDSQRYLNIWVVKSISGATPPSYILGYAQFPNQGSAKTDGVVLRSDVVGDTLSVLSGGFSTNKGRTATHEVGHWLGLRHIWGDANCGDDGIDDTPVHKTSNANCSSYPKINNCPGGDPVHGEMYMNYMDYTDGICQNMFSQGQKDKFDYTFANYRATLISDANLVNTGTDSVRTSSCMARADFCLSQLPFGCSGVKINFTDKSWGGTPSTYKWSFPGSDTPVSTSANPLVTYSTPGTYNVTMSVTNAAGTDSTVRTSLVHVGASTAQYTAPFSDDFESADLATKGWVSFNKDNDKVNWAIISTIGYSGNNSVKLSNYSSPVVGLTDGLISPSIDFSQLTTPFISFKVSYKTKSSSSTDRLNIYYSTNCGKNYFLLKGFGQTEMSSGTMSSNFTPSGPVWKNINVSASQLIGKTNAMIKLEFVSGTGGNNIYIDDINISNSAVTGIQNAKDFTNFIAYPNPTEERTTIAFDLAKAGAANLSIFDVLGREVKSILSNTMLENGEHKFDVNLHEKGVYFIRLIVGNQTLTQKLVVR